MKRTCCRVGTASARQRLDERSARLKGAISEASFEARLVGGRAFYSLHQLVYQLLLVSETGSTGASGVEMAGQWKKRSQHLGAYAGLDSL